MLGPITADCKKLEHVSRMLYAGCPSFLGFGLEDGHVPTFRPPFLWVLGCPPGAAAVDFKVLFKSSFGAIGPCNVRAVLGYPHPQGYDLAAIESMGA